jgi:type VI secretion system secreted protein Hcp
MAQLSFLKIDGVPGESFINARTDWIEILSYAHGISQAGLFGSLIGGSGFSGGQAVHEDIRLVKALDKASPLLFAACCEGQIFKQAVLEVVEPSSATGAIAVALKVTLSGVVITAFRPTADANNIQPPLEEISLNYRQIVWEYTPYSQTGAPQPVIRAGWDLDKNGKF